MPARRDLKEEHVDALELAYTDSFGSTTIGLSVYQNDIQDNINFVSLLPSAEFPTGLPGLKFYTPQNPARGVQPTGPGTFRPITLDPRLMGALATIPNAFGGPKYLPSRVSTYLNIGPIRNRGFEASIEHRVNSQWLLNANYSWQDEPKILEPDADQIEYPATEVGLAPVNRFNVGVSYNGRRFLGNVNVNYAGRTPRAASPAC